MTNGKLIAWHWVTAQASLRLLHFKERSVFIIIMRGLEV
jgi:hypothetical protein